jgi:glycosyltransferase involved in cell wall biosynthesis
MPAYNEEQGIADAVAEVLREVLARVPGSELIVVDDGSRDATGRILDALARDEPAVRVIHQPNGGHGRALRTGLDAATGDYLLLVDSDRQVPLSSFAALWEAARGREGALGVRESRDDPWFRKLLSALIRAVVPLLFGVRVRDPNAPFKLVRRGVWQAASERIPGDALAPSLMLAVFIRRRGLDVVDQPVPHRRRGSGRGFPPLTLVPFCLRGFRELLAFRGRLAA